jgi:titin
MKVGNVFGLSEASYASAKMPTASPSTPTITDIVGGNGMATVSFTLGDSNGGEVLFCGYSLDGINYLYTPNTTSPMEIYGLTNGYTYNVSIKAVNTFGLSEESNIASVTPITTPSTPIIIGITPESDTLIVKLIESNPNGYETVDYYYSLNGGDYILADAPVNSSITIYNLPTGIQYTVLFKAHNSSGFSSASNSYEVLLPKLPPVPIITNVEPDNGKVSVYFSTSAIENAADIICYKYRLNDGTTDFYTNSAQSPVVVYGLENGVSYTVKIKAVTSIGETSFSLNSPAFIPYSYPDPPVITSVLPGNGNALVYFNELNGNGSEVTKISYYNGLTYVDLSGVTSPVTISGLSNKTNYNILLVAHNEGGMSRLSNMKSIIPGTPYAPVITSVVAGAAKATIYFNQPTTTNGSAIVNFNYDTGNGVQVKASSMTSPIVVPGLINGKSYTISLYAVNANGSSVVSNIVGNICPFTTPSVIIISAVTPIYHTPTTSAALVSFIPPANNGTSITKYMYAVGTSTTYSDVSGVIPPLNITGLPMNTNYTLKLIAVNNAGNSLPSPASKPTKFTYSTPAQVKVTTVGTSDQRLTVNFVAPASNGAPITTYLYSLNGGSYVDSLTATPPVVINGVQNNTNHNLQIVAVNDAGQSTPSALLSKPVQIIYLTPLAPKINTIIGQNNALDVNFTPSVIRGAPVTTYYYSFDSGNTLVNANTTVSPFRINGLINDVSYSVCLVADSAAGNSVISNKIMQKPILAVPAAPKINTITPGNQRAVVAYTASLANGAPITNYVYTTNAGNTYVSIDSSSNPLTIIGLTNNITYNLSIAAVNSVGRSLPSAPMVVMPRYTVPSAPVINTATAGAGATATVAFTVSSPNGGTISTYKYTFDDGETYINANSVKTPIIIRYLTPGQSYTIKMIAVNELGDSVASNTKTFTARS